jgi:hypothetical protein
MRVHERGGEIEKGGRGGGGREKERDEIGREAGMEGGIESKRERARERVSALEREKARVSERAS